MYGPLRLELLLCADPFGLTGGGWGCRICRMKRAWFWVLWVAVAATPWMPGLRHPFLYDDIGIIAENDFLAERSNVFQTLSARTLADPGVINGRRPAVLVSYFLDREWHGLQPAGWRVTSLLLHLGCAVMLMTLLRRSGAGEFAACAAGWVFALHPALVEAVHAPGFRADVLCLFFMLAALHGLSAMRKRPWAGLAWAGVCTALALLSKETALVFPLLAACCLFGFPGAFPTERERRWAGVGVCTVLAGGFFVLWAMLPTDLQAVGGAWDGVSLRFPQNLFSAPALWLRTLRFAAWPWPLNVTPPFEPVASPGTVRFWLGMAGLGIWLGVAWRLRTVAPRAALGMGWMLVFFLPVANVWPLFHPVADRYLYPIVAGWAILVAEGLSRWPARGRSAGLAGLAAIYAVLIILRVSEWRSAESLWSAAYDRNPRSATAATWLGLLRAEAGDLDGARSWYEAATAANPHATAAWINWGILEGRAGNWVESERLLRRAVELRPEGAKGWHNLAIFLERQGRLDEAAEAAARAAALHPGYGREKP